MLFRRHAASWWLMLSWLYLGSAMCPTDCVCRQTDKGRRKVACLLGGMLDPIPTTAMSPDMQVLEITAPQHDRWNVLTLGPIFQSFKFLEELHIERSNLLQIGMHVFWGVPTLKVLNLSYNNISAVFDHNFRGLVNLVELNLEGNQIDKVPSGAFKHLSELKVLNLQKNRIKEIVMKSFNKLSKLDVLKLSWNTVSELSPEVFKDILELRVLHCRGCGLRWINTQIYHLLPYLTHLDLGYNRMQFIDAEEFLDLHRLRVLHLDGNQLPVILERTFVNNVHLRVLCLANNRLAKITDHAFVNLTNLVELDIGYNRLDRLDGASFRPLAEKLQKLVLSGNSFTISMVELVLEIVVNINDLALADMDLIDYPSGLFPDHLRKLNLSGNHLSNLSVQMLPRQLVALDISRNKFSGLGEHVAIRLEKLEAVEMGNNAWTCDLCHISPMLFRANRTDTFRDVTCASPGRLKGRTVGSLRYDEVSPCDDADVGGSKFAQFVKEKLGLIVAAASLVVFLILCILFVVYSCLRRHATREVAIVKEKERRRQHTVLDEPTAIFVGGKNEISFKFPLDLPDRKMSVSTIDEMKKESHMRSLPNGTGI